MCLASPLRAQREQDSKIAFLYNNVLLACCEDGQLKERDDLLLPEDAPVSFLEIHEQVVSLAVPHVRQAGFHPLKSSGGYILPVV